MHPARVLVASRLNLDRPGYLPEMGFYRAFVLPQLLDLSERMSGMEGVRQRTVEYATGHTLEIGVGIGSTLPFYTEEVTSLTTVEPNPSLNARVRRRLRHLPFPVDTREGRAEQLPMKECSFDTAVTTFAMCCIDEIERVAAEIHRVLKPGGRFYFAELGLSRDTKIAKWQRRLAGLQRTVVDGCRVDRSFDTTLLTAGFEIKRLDISYLDGMPKALGCVYEGLAVKQL